MGLRATLRLIAGEEEFMRRGINATDRQTDKSMMGS